MGFLPALALALAAGCPASTREPPSFVPGEVIVKFAEPKPRGDFLEALSRELRVPLRPVETTAGAEHVLSIDADRLVASLTEKLEADGRILSVERKTIEPKYIGEPGQTHLVVRFKEPAPHSESDFLESVEQDVGVPLQVVDSGRDMTLAIDLPALTLELVERLKARPDVAYAQTNNLLHPQ